MRGEGAGPVPGQVREQRLAGRLEQVARLTPHAIVLCGPEGLIDWVNDGFTAATGYSLEEARGRKPGALLQGPETDPKTVSMMRARLAAREGFRIEVLNRTKDGRPLWLDLDVRPMFDADGALEGFMAIQVEVTRAIQLHQQLAATSAALRSAGRLAQVGGWEIDIAQGVVRWSPELQQIYRRPIAIEGLEQSLGLYSPEERELVTEQVVRAIESGERVDFEARAITGDGEPLWVRVMGEPEFRDGRCVAVRGASQDITAQRQALLELRQSERFARGVIDGLAAMLVVIDEAGVILEANKAFRERGAEVRNEPTYLMGRNLFAVLGGLPGAHGSALERGIRRVLNRRSENFNRAYQSESGEWFRLTAALFAGEGPVRCVVFTQSIEDLKRSERRLRTLNGRLEAARDAADAANAAKSAFLATMSHEIRTPLNGVLGMAQAMANDRLPRVQRERLTVIRQAGETLLTLLNDLLDLSRIEAGRLELEDGCVDMVAVAQAAQGAFASLAEEKGLRLAVEVAADARGPWRGDPTRVRQILYNLVSNAVKFTETGEVLVRAERQGAMLVLQVRDTGPGVAADRLEALFDKFVQADTSTTRRYGGSGLGLAICRQLAALMGGEIGVESQLGRGATFTVRLPLEPYEGVDAVDAVPAAAQALAGAPLRILAADDNPMNQLVLRTLLQQLGLDVHVVSDGAQAVAAWNDADWSVILMDVQMPVMDGPTAARHIRALEIAQGRPRTPIIALTANAMAHHQAEYAAAGMDALVPKPIELQSLIAAIEQAVDPAAGGAALEEAVGVDVDGDPDRRRRLHPGAPGGEVG